MEADFEANRVEVGDVSAQATLNIYYHVIYANTSLSGGYVPDSQLTAQTDVMNAAYSNMGKSDLVIQIVHLVTCLRNYLGDC
jgi:hypothetical protein